ncbi:hypothetical protein [Bacillus infantis]|uniref:hypothetical protein n=1 Tax=Bacillus infantis TaxID=324767 RepID=UPI003CF1EF02
MAIQQSIISVEGIQWEKDHNIPEMDTSFLEFIESGEIAVGDSVTIENKEECPFPMPVDVYCLTFKKGDFFTEEPFTLDERKLLFGEGFSY